MRVLFFIILLDISGFGILLPSIMFVLQKMGAGPGYATAIIATYSIGQFIAGPVWGQLSDRVGRKPILLISMSGAFCAYLLMMVAKSPEVILASRVLAGLMAGNIATAYAAVADLTPPEKRSKGMGVLGAAFGLGFVIGPAIGGFLGGSTPETATIFYPSMASAIMSSLAIMATFFFFKESLSLEHRNELKSRPRISRLDALKKVILHPTLKWFCVFIFLVSTAAALMEPVTPLLVGNRYGWGPLNMGYIFVIVGLVIATVQGGLVGKLAKYFGEKNMVKIAMTTFITGLLLIIYTPVSYGVVIALCFTGVSTTLFTTAISALASHRAHPTERGLVMGVIQSMQSFGRSMGPLFAGSLFAFWDGLPYFVGAVMAAGVLGGIIVLARRVVIEDASVRVSKRV